MENRNENRGDSASPKMVPAAIGPRDCPLENRARSTPRMPYVNIRFIRGLSRIESVAQRQGVVDSYRHSDQLGRHFASEDSDAKSQRYS